MQEATEVMPLMATDVPMLEVMEVSKHSIDIADV